MVSNAPFVTGMVTLTTIFIEVWKQFLTEVAGLDPLSVLDCFLVRLLSVAQGHFLDRLPHLRPVSFRSFFVCTAVCVCVCVGGFVYQILMDCVAKMFIIFGHVISDFLLIPKTCVITGNTTDVVPNVLP